MIDLVPLERGRGLRSAWSCSGCSVDFTVQQRDLDHEEYDSPERSPKITPLPSSHDHYCTWLDYSNGVGTFLRSQLLPTYPCEGGTHQTSWGLYHTALHAHILPDYARAKIVAPDSPIEASSTCVTPSWQRPEDGQSKVMSACRSVTN